MKKSIKNLIIVSSVVAVIGIVLLLISNTFTENIIDLYNVDFSKFEFKKDQVYSYEVEVLNDYFYKKILTGKSKNQYYYFNAQLKNKYSDGIYVVYELNSGARTNMIKSENRTFKRKGIIRNITNNINKSRKKTLADLESKDEVQVYDIYFGLSTKDNLKNIGILFIAISIFFMVIIAPIINLKDKKKKV